MGPTFRLTHNHLRTINIIITLDAAFLFFQNYPCRFAFAELECDLPCEESLFSSRNPFTEPHFLLSRELSLKKGTELMFGDGLAAAELAYANRSSTSSSATRSRTMFNVFDMFILIHGKSRLHSIKDKSSGI